MKVPRFVLAGENDAKASPSKTPIKRPRFSLTNVGHASKEGLKYRKLDRGQTYDKGGEKTADASKHSMPYDHVNTTKNETDAPETIWGATTANNRLPSLRVIKNTGIPTWSPSPKKRRNNYVPGGHLDKLNSAAQDTEDWLALQSEVVNEATPHISSSLYRIDSCTRINRLCMSVELTQQTDIDPCQNDSAPVKSLKALLVSLKPSGIRVVKDELLVLGAPFLKLPDESGDLTGGDSLDSSTNIYIQWRIIEKRNMNENEKRKKEGNENERRNMNENENDHP